MKNRAAHIFFFLTFAFARQFLLAQDSIDMKGELIWKTDKYQIFVPGEKCIVDSITVTNQTYKNQSWRIVGDLFVRYSNWQTYEHHKFYEENHRQYTVGYYPNGKTWFEDFYSRGEGKYSSNQPDSVKGYYSWGSLQYRVVLDKSEDGFSLYHSTDKNGEDELLKNLLKGTNCKKYALYFPDGTLMEEERADTNEQGKTYRSWKTEHFEYGCSRDPVGHHFTVMDKYYYRLNKKYFPGGNLKTFVSYCQTPGDEKKHINYYREWDIAGHLMYEGKTFGVPDSTDYNEVWQKFYPDGKIEWEMNHKQANLIMKWEDPDKITPAWFTYEPNAYLIHYDEQGNVIKKMGK